jgi:hypothetical protein
MLALRNAPALDRRLIATDRVAALSRALREESFRAKERIYAITPRGIGDSVWFALHAPESGLRPPHYAR